MENVAIKKPQDFVICTGKQYSIKEFINFVSNNWITQLFGRVKALMKKHIIKNQCVIEINKKYFRPAEVDSLVGNYKKQKKF